MIRIFLVITILAGVGAIFVGTKLKSDKNKLQLDLTETSGKFDSQKRDLEKEKTAREDAAKRAEEKEKALKTAHSEMENTKNVLVAQQTKTKEIEENLSKTARDLSEKTAEIDKILQSLPAGMTMDQMLTEFKGKQEESGILDQEKKVLNDRLAKTTEELKKYQKSHKGEISSDLTGHVLEVNDDWNFVVIDLGIKHGLPQVIDKIPPFIVYRDGNLVGRLKISSVESSISIADVIPEWKQSEIQEGDVVILSSALP